MMRHGTAYKRVDAWYLCPSRQSTVGVWLAGPPYIRLPITTNPVVLGQYVFKILEASFGIVPHPKNPDDMSTELPELARVNSWEQFSKCARCLSFESDEATITIIPWKPYDEHGAYTAKDDLKLKVAADVTPEALGNAILQAIELSE